MKPTYSKIIKGILLALIVLSVAVFAFGWIYGYETNGSVAVDALFIWAYVMLGIALVSIVLVGGVIGVMNDKKFLVKILNALNLTEMSIRVTILCFLNINWETFSPTH